MPAVSVLKKPAHTVTGKTIRAIQKEKEGFFSYGQLVPHKEGIFIAIGALFRVLFSMHNNNYYNVNAPLACRTYNVIKACHDCIANSWLVETYPDLIRDSFIRTAAAISLLSPVRIGLVNVSCNTCYQSRPRTMNFETSKV